MPGEWLTTGEACALLKLSRTRLADLRRAQVFRMGEHYTRPEGMRIRWRRVALEAHLDGQPAAGSDRRRARSKLNPALLAGLK